MYLKPRQPEDAPEGARAELLSLGTRSIPRPNEILQSWLYITKHLARVFDFIKKIFFPQCETG